MRRRNVPLWRYVLHMARESLTRFLPKNRFQLVILSTQVLSAAIIGYNTGSAAAGVASVLALTTVISLLGGDLTGVAFTSAGGVAAYFLTALFTCNVVGAPVAFASAVAFFTTYLVLSGSGNYFGVLLGFAVLRWLNSIPGGAAGVGLLSNDSSQKVTQEAPPRQMAAGAV